MSIWVGLSVVGKLPGAMVVDNRLDMVDKDVNLGGFISSG